MAYSYELYHGGLAQLARALALQAKGHRFDSDILHQIAEGEKSGREFFKTLIMARGLVIRNHIIITLIADSRKFYTEGY